jgi:hypothetical protein
VGAAWIVWWLWGRDGIRPDPAFEVPRPVPSASAAPDDDVFMPAHPAPDPEPEPVLPKNPPPGGAKPKGP